MTAAWDGDLGAPIDIDMDRVVVDAEYRRRVIRWLRQERLLAQAYKVEGADLLDPASAEDD